MSSRHDSRKAGRDGDGSSRGGAPGSAAARGPTVGELVVEGERALGESGIPPARLEAEVLLARRMSLGRAGLLTRFEHVPGTEVIERFRADIGRRACRYPLQYITGIQEFYSLEFEVDERVLIPRPETEMIVDEVIRLVRSGSRDEGPSGALQRQVSDAHDGLLYEGIAAATGRSGNRNEALSSAGATAPAEAPITVVDVGTGSGCIAIAIAVNLPSCQVIAIDVSGPALEVARKNASRHGVEDRVRFLQGDGLAPLRASHQPRGSQVEEPVAPPSASSSHFRTFVADFVVSNPPYIAASEMEGLQRELRHEPRVALTAGREGLEVTTRLIRDAADAVKPGGWLMIELSAVRAAAATRLLDPAFWDRVDTRSDHQGFPRLLMARRRVVLE